MSPAVPHWRIPSLILAMSVLLAGLAALAPRSALAITVSDCSDLGALKTTLEAGGEIILDCGPISLALDSEIVIDDDTTIDGLGQTTLSGAETHRVIRVDGSVAGVTVTLRGLTIEDGFVAGAGGGVYADGRNGKQVTLHLEDMTFSANQATHGGAIFSDGESGNATLTATHTTFTGNTAEFLGGAVYNDGSDNGDATMIANQSTFSGNAASAGGAVYLDGPADGSASLTASDTIFSANSASTGGAIYGYGVLAGSATVETTNTTFSGNTATNSGGAVLSDGSDDGSATLTTTDTTFTGNSASSGGAVYSYGFDGSASLTTTNTTFSGNSATGGSGGAVFSDGSDSGSATLTATTTTFSGNQAYAAGAVYNYGVVSGYASLEATNSTFSGNTASGPGGAVYNHGTNGGNAILDTTHTTFSGNAADTGSVVFSFGFGGSATLIFAATILANSSGDHCYDAGGTTFTSADFNLADNNDGSCNLTNTNDQVVSYAGLAGLADNGGPTQTHALLATAPAVDAIPVADCPVPTDQRGVTRPQDGNTDGASLCDIGAVERIGTVLLGSSLRRFPTFNAVVAGSRVHVYFTYDGKPQTDILASAMVGVVSCTSKQPVAGTQPAQSGGLYWQANYKRYVYVWQTNKNWPAGCRQLVLTFVDGSALRLNVQIIKPRWQ